MVLAEGDATIWDKLAIAAMQITAFGQEFVVLFFVLSGFAMAHSVQFSKNTARFYEKRAIRVWIPYLAATVFAALICWSITELVPVYPAAKGCVDTLCDPIGLARVALYISPQTALTPQFWSLPYEILFYAMAPFILSSKARVVIGFAVATVGTCVSFVFYGLNFNPVDSVVLNFLLQELMLFEIGAMAYYFVDRIPVVQGRKFLLATIAGTLAAMLSRLYIGETNILSNLITSGLTVFILCNLPDLFGKSRFNLGYVSYSLYIFHYAVIVAIGAILFQVWGMTQQAMSSYFAWILALPAILGICWIMWWVAERPTTLWLEAVRRRERAAQPVRPPQV